MGEACTIVLRGATKQILDEAERSLHDALCVLTQTVKNTKTVYGGGKLETQIYMYGHNFIIVRCNSLFKKHSKWLMF